MCFLLLCHTPVKLPGTTYTLHRLTLASFLHLEQITRIRMHYLILSLRFYLIWVSFFSSIKLEEHAAIRAAGKMGSRQQKIFNRNSWCATLPTFSGMHPAASPLAHVQESSGSSSSDMAWLTFTIRLPIIRHIKSAWISNLLASALDGQSWRNFSPL